MSVDKPPINRWRWLVLYILRSSSAFGPLERLILRAASEQVQSIEGARVALACVEQVLGGFGSEWVK